MGETYKEERKLIIESLTELKAGQKDLSTKFDKMNETVLQIPVVFNKCVDERISIIDSKYSKRIHALAQKADTIWTIGKVVIWLIVSVGGFWGLYELFNIFNHG